MIHETAIIDKNAKIPSSTSIGPYVVIGPEVELGNNVIVHSHVSIMGKTKIGDGNIFFPFSSIGNDPQDLKYKGEKSSLVIGDNNKIREYVTMNPGTLSGGGITKVGSNCLFMIGSHIAHDCNVGNNVIIANNVPLGGHAEIGDGMTGVLNDVIPYGLSIGNRNHLQGLNLIGLRRAKTENKIILELTEAYKDIFRSKNLSENLKNLPQKYEKNVLVQDVIEFINKDKKRSIAQPLNLNESNR